MLLFFITGSSGVGKTPLVGILKSILPDNFVIYDLDEELKNADKSLENWVSIWRNETTRHFIGEAIKNARLGKSTIVCGLVWPHEILSAPNLKLAPQLKIIFLDVTADELRKRLFSRRWSDEQKIADLKKDTGLTPEQYIAKNSLEVSELKSECVKFNAEIIDTTKLDPGEVAMKIKDLFFK